MSTDPVADPLPDPSTAIAWARVQGALSGPNVTSRDGRRVGSTASREQYRAQYAVFAGQPVLTTQFGLYSSIESLRSPARSVETRPIRSASDAANVFEMSTSLVGNTLVWLPAKSAAQVFRNMNAEPSARGDDRTGSSTRVAGGTLAIPSSGRVSQVTPVSVQLSLARKMAWWFPAPFWA